MFVVRMIKALGKKRRFLMQFLKKVVSSNSIPCQFCTCWMPWHFGVFVTRRGLTLGAKCMLYLAHMCGIMLCESETRPVKEVDVTTLEKNDARMLRKMCNVRSEDMISVVKLKKDGKWIP